MNLKKYLSIGVSALSVSCNGALGAGALAPVLIATSLTPSARSIIHSQEGQAFLAAAWGERGFLREVIFLREGEAAPARVLLRVLDELQSQAGQKFVRASLSLAERPGLTEEIAAASAQLKKIVRRWLHKNGKAHAACAEFQIYGRSLESIIDAYIDNAVHDLIEARDAYPVFFSDADGTLSERPLQRLSGILDRFFERYPLPDLSFVKIPPHRISESAIAPLNDTGLSTQITAVNFQKTVAPPGGLTVSLRIEGQRRKAIVAVAGFEFLRELEANERCFVARYRMANGYPVILSYEKGPDIVAVPACLSTDLIAGTISGPLKFQQVNNVRLPLLGRLRLNLADRVTRKAVFSSTEKKLSAVLWLLPPGAGRDFVRMLERLFPTAMQEITTQLHNPEQSVWTLSRHDLLNLQ